MRHRFIFLLLLFCVSLLYAGYPKVGKKAPKIQVADWVTGKIPGENPFTGKTTILEFWGTWCAPCVAAIPHLNRLSEKFASSQVVFVSITDQERAPVEEFLKDHEMKSFVALDRGRKTFDRYGVTSVPHTFLIDQKGILRWHGYPTELTEQVLAEFLKSGAVPEIAEVWNPDAASGKTSKLPRPYSHRRSVKYTFRLIGKVHLQKADTLSTGDLSFAVFRDGRLSMADRGDCTVRLYSPDGKFIKSISRKGNGSGESQTLLFHCIDESGRVWIDDYILQRVSVYDTSGSLLDTWYPAKSCRDCYVAPGLIRVVGKRIYVGLLKGDPTALKVNNISSLVTAFDFNRNRVADYGTFGKWPGDYSVGFDRYMYDVDPSGKLYGIAEFSNVIWKYSPDGKMLRRFNYPVRAYRPAIPFSEYQSTKKPQATCGGPSNILVEWYASATTNGKVEIVGKYLFVSFVNKDPQWAEHFERGYWHEYIQVFDLDGNCLVDYYKAPGQFLGKDEAGVLYFLEGGDRADTVVSKYRFSVGGE